MIRNVVVESKTHFRACSLQYSLYSWVHRQRFDFKDYERSYMHINCLAVPDCHFKMWLLRSLSHSDALKVTVTCYWTVDMKQYCVTMLLCWKHSLSLMLQAIFLYLALHNCSLGYANVDCVLWLGGREVRMLDLWSACHRFKSWPAHYRVRPWASWLHTRSSITGTSQWSVMPCGVKLTIRNHHTGQTFELKA